jgi:hypothetical protein
MADDCSTLSLKINYLEHTIASHVTWDRDHPNPAYPSGRHVDEIADLRRAVENCKAIYTTKCTNQPIFYPVPVPFVEADVAGAATEVEIAGAAAAEAEGGFGLLEALELLFAL